MIVFDPIGALVIRFYSGVTRDRRRACNNRGQMLHSSVEEEILWIEIALANGS
jgi:hypothetical protein